ncbi:hypothetical protein ACERII_18460 [Evansella sp. AB-rgal1]|uniref:hypothetical protein n=1 Tax=Evansella sp. AB-rgal1 TaxID=3242696 RepID=UPI00359EF86A
MKLKESNGKEEYKNLQKNKFLFIREYCSFIIESHSELEIQMMERSCKLQASASNLLSSMIISILLSIMSITVAIFVPVYFAIITPLTTDVQYLGEYLISIHEGVNIIMICILLILVFTIVVVIYLFLSFVHARGNHHIYEHSLRVKRESRE